MILGIGTDIVNTIRIADICERTGSRFARKILSDDELKRFEAHHNPVAFLAKRFAAKEAAAKALGTGIGVVTWHDIQIINNDLGAPVIVAGITVQNRMQQIGAKHLHLSLADEHDAAIAFVVAEA